MLAVCRGPELALELRTPGLQVVHANQVAEVHDEWEAYWQDRQLSLLRFSQARPLVGRNQSAPFVLLAVCIEAHRAESGFEPQTSRLQVICENHSARTRLGWLPNLQNSSFFDTQITNVPAWVSKQSSHSPVTAKKALQFSKKYYVPSSFQAWLQVYLTRWLIWSTSEMWTGKSRNKTDR